MTALITGGSGSGKSEFAERLAVSLGEDRLYAATMLPMGREAAERIRRHREMRHGRGFRTQDCYTNLSELEAARDTVVLLECVSNLLANIMFPQDGVRCADPSGEVVSQIDELRSRCGSLVIVSNEIFSDGSTYDDDTMLYIKNLAVVNRRLACLADTVAEIVCGIPLYVKGRTV